MTDARGHWRADCQGSCRRIELAARAISGPGGVSAAAILPQQ